MRFFSFFTLCSLLLIAGCSTDSGSNEVPLNVEGSFEETSLTQQNVFELEFNGEHLYAGTGNNLYRKSISKTGWAPMGLPNVKIRTFVVLSSQSLLAAFNIDNRDSLTIVQTTDGGQRWIPFRNGFGGDINRRIPLTMKKDSSNPNILFAAGPGAGDIAKSVDQGQSWKLISGTWENFGFLFFLKLYNSAIIWSGGSTATFAPHLIKSTDGGNTWQEITILENVENTAYDIAFHPSDANRVLAGLGGGIHKSTDGGQNWRTTLQGIDALTLINSVRNPEVVYASGRNQTGTLFFAASTNFGDDWEIVEMEGATEALFINDIISVMEDGTEVLYFGTTKGVYKYTFDE